MGTTLSFHRHALGLALCLLAGGALAQASTTPSTGKLAHADHEFVENALQGGLYEVEESQIALARTQNTQVKGFAQQMVDDHTKAGQELSALAAAKGEKPVDKPSVAQRTKIDLLKMHKDGFDKDYAESQVNAHESAVKLFRKEAADGKDAEVKAFAEKTLPALEHHLQMAQELKSTTSGKAVSSR